MKCHSPAMGCRAVGTGRARGAIALPPIRLDIRKTFSFKRPWITTCPLPPWIFRSSYGPGVHLDGGAGASNPISFFPKPTLIFHAQFSHFSKHYSALAQIILTIELHTIHLISRHLLYYFMNNLSLQNDLRKYFQYFKQHHYNRPIKRIMYYEKCAMLVRY